MTSDMIQFDQLNATNTGHHLGALVKHNNRILAIGGTDTATMEELENGNWIGSATPSEFSENTTFYGFTDTTVFDELYLFGGMYNHGLSQGFPVIFRVRAGSN